MKLNIIKNQFHQQTEGLQLLIKLLDNLSKDSSMFDKNPFINNSSDSIRLSSTSQRRITRKTDISSYNGLSSRSKSKKVQSSFDTSFQQYCTKHLGSNTPTAKIQQLKKSIHQINPQKVQQQYLVPKVPSLLVERKKKKRDATPVKSRRELLQTQETKISDDEDRKICDEAFMTSLQQDYNRQVQMKQKLILENENLENQLRKYKTEIDKYQQQKYGLKKDNQRLQNDNKNLRQVIEISQNNLATATSTLKKLKQTIRENKIHQLQIDKQNLLQFNQRLKLQIKQLKQTIEKLNACNQILSGEIQQYKGRHDEVNQYEKNRERRQGYLFQQISHLRSKINELESLQKSENLDILTCKNRQIKKLQVLFEEQRRKNHYLNLKLNEQLQKIKKQKDAQIKKARVKYSRMIQNLKQRSTQKQNYKLSPIFRNHNRNSNDHITFELSPEP